MSDVKNDPKNLILMLSIDRQIFPKMCVYKNDQVCKWELADGLIINKETKLYMSIIDNTLMLSKIKNAWKTVCHKQQIFLFNVTRKLYLSLTIEYQIFLTNDIQYASSFVFKDGLILYIKPGLLINFEKNNMTLKNFNIEKIDNIIKKHVNDGINVGILLAGGTSSRFKSNKLKQLFLLNGKPIILHSIESMVEILDKIIVVTNTGCHNEIKNIIKYPNIHIITNDVNCRLESIIVAMKYIEQKLSTLSDIKNIVIHDAVRPFIEKKHIENLLQIGNKYLYTSYSLKLVNGLHKTDPYQYEIVDREDYIELCTPSCIDYKLFNFILTNYMTREHRIVWEVVNILDLLKIKYIMINGHHSYLRKITVIEDITHFN